jgi:hypothetical protein
MKTPLIVPAFIFIVHIIFMIYLYYYSISKTGLPTFENPPPPPPPPQNVDDDDEDYDDSDECCEECGCYHGHHSWCPDK